MKIRIGNQTAWAAPLRAPFDFAVANGFDAFEWFPDKKPEGGWDDADLTAAARRDLRETARVHGIRLSVHARWQANPLQPESAPLFGRDIQLACDLGAELLNIHLCHEHGIAAFVEAIRPLIRRTKEAGLQLAVENTPHHSPEDFNGLFSQLLHLDAPHVGMCLDLGHANLCAATRNDYLKFLGRLAPHVPVIHLHLHENYGDADTHLPLFTGPAGRDDAGIRGLAAWLQRRNFSGSAIFEQWPQPPALLQQARDRLEKLLEETPPPPPVPQPHFAPPAAGLDEFAQRLVEGDRHRRSWREKLDFIREILAAETAPTPSQLVDTAVYLRFLNTGEIACAEDGRHFRPSHHAGIAEKIRGRLAGMAAAETNFVLRKICPCLPSSAQEFRRAEPLTRIRDIAHRNDIPAELKREIKTALQNKLHRCAGPEDLATSAALLARITAPGADFAPGFVAEFKIFHAELQEFFNASSLDDRLQALLPALDERSANLARQFLSEKKSAAPEARLAAFRSLTELRRQLAAADKTRLPPAELLLADIGLEDFAFVLLGELAAGLEAAGAWEPLLEIFQAAAENFALGGAEPDESAVVAAELRAWRAAFDPADRNQLMRLKATAGRARRLAENFSGRILAAFAQRAEILGAALGVSEPAIRVFAEAEVRSHLVFQFSRLATGVLQRIRTALAQPAWDVVVAGRAAGKVVSLAKLEGKFSEPALVLLRSAEGDEELPAGVAGVVVAHELPHLSHLAVRARQSGVVLVACEEPALMQEFKKLEGKIISLHATAEKVEWTPADTAAAVSAQKVEVRIPEIECRPEKKCVPLEQALAVRAGNKADGARRLAELARKPGSGFKTPGSLAVPFGVMESALLAMPEVFAEYKKIMGGINTATGSLPAAAEKLRGLVQRLEVPAEIAADVIAKFGRESRLMVRSSANDEDLARLAGAGLYESVANVPAGGVATAVRAVWASLWTRRAAVSRQQAGVPQTQARMAVLVQEMLVPDFSFILHTANPVSGRRDEIYAELAAGLGETLASANAPGNPWRLVCNKKSGDAAVLAFANFSVALWPDAAGGTVRKIVDYSCIPLSSELEKLLALGRRLASVAKFVETEFGFPQDIEGVVKGGEIFLVQARPQQGLEAA